MEENKDKKGFGLAILLSKGKKPPKEDNSEENEMSEEEEYSNEEEEEGLNIAIEEMLTAIEEKDSESLKEALKSFIKQC